MSNNPMNIISADIESSLRAFINTFTDGVQQKTYTGIVEDNNDPDKLGRCRIRVYSVFGEIDKKNLPWAVPKKTFIGSTVGNFVVPKIGTLVDIEFRDGVVYNPEYSLKTFNKNQLPDERLQDYPDTMVLWSSDDGDYVTLNRKTKQYQFRHASGLLFNIDKKGNVTLDNTAGSGCDITVINKGAIQFQTASLEVANDMGAMVMPNPAGGGPFCALPNCVFSGAPHQGKIVKNCLSKHSDV